MTVGELFGFAWVLGAAGFLFVLILVSSRGIHLKWLWDAPVPAAGSLAAAGISWALAFTAALVAPAMSGDVSPFLPWAVAAACLILSFLGARFAPGAWPSVVAATILGGAIIAAVLGDYLTYLLEWQGRSLDGYGSDDIPGSIMVWVAIVVWVPFGLLAGLLTGALAARTRPRQS